MFGPRASWYGKLAKFAAMATVSSSFLITIFSIPLLLLGCFSYSVYIWWSTGHNGCFHKVHSLHAFTGDDENFFGIACGLLSTASWQGDHTRFVVAAMPGMSAGNDEFNQPFSTDKVVFAAMVGNDDTMTFVRSLLIMMCEIGTYLTRAALTE
ncbi:hypothetical protein Tco_0430992 [Tanacetum coccineum]